MDIVVAAVELPAGESCAGCLCSVGKTCSRPVCLLHGSVVFTGTAAWLEAYRTRYVMVLAGFAVACYVIPFGCVMPCLLTLIVEVYRLMCWFAGMLCS